MEKKSFAPWRISICYANYTFARNFINKPTKLEYNYSSKIVHALCRGQLLRLVEQILCYTTVTYIERVLG